MAGKTTIKVDADTSGAERALGNLQNRLLALASVSAFVKLSDDLTTISNKIRTVSNSIAESEAAFKAVSQVALRTGMSFNATADLYQKIGLQSKALGLSQQEMVRITENFNNALRVSGTTGAAATSAIYQLGQALGRGKVAYEDIRQLQEASSNTLTLIAKQFGWSSQQFIENVQKGKVSSEQLALAINGLGKDIKDLPVLTISQELENLYTQSVITFKEFDKATGITKNLATMIRFAADHIEEIGIVAGAALAAFSAKKVLDIAMAFKTLNTVLKANPFVLAATILAAGGVALYEMYKGTQKATEEQEKYNKAVDETEEKIRNVQDATDKTAENQRKDLADFFTKLENQIKLVGLSEKELMIRRNITDAANTLKITESQLTAEQRARAKALGEQEYAIKKQYEIQQLLSALSDEALNLAIEDNDEREQANRLLSIKNKLGAEYFYLYEAEIRNLTEEIALQTKLNTLRSAGQQVLNPLGSNISGDIFRALKGDQAGIIGFYDSINNTINSIAGEHDSWAQALSRVKRQEEQLMLLQERLIQLQLEGVDTQEQRARVEMALGNARQGMLETITNATIANEKRMLDSKFYAINQEKMMEAEMFNYKISLLNKEADIRQALKQKELMNQGWTLEQASQMSRENADFMKKTETEKAQWAIQQAGSVLDELGKTNKTAFQAAKAFNIANAIMNTYAGVTKALATYPPPFNFIAAGTTLAMGLAQVATIRSQQYSGRAIGGTVGGNNSYIVGERGPELFTPTGSGTITPSQNLRSQGDVSVNFTINAVDTRNFQQLLAEQKGLIVGMVRSAVNDRGRTFSA